MSILARTPAPPPTITFADEPAPRKRGKAGMIAWVLVAAASGGAGYGYWKRGQIRIQRTSEAVELDMRVEKLLKSARPAEFAEAETNLSRAFDLAPAQPLTALAWLRERILRALWLDPATPGVETAITRAEQSGVAEAELLFARAGVLVARGRTKEAVDLLERAGAVRDAYAHFVAGVALERAGDARALQELEAAARMDKELVFARVLAAEHLLVESIPRATEALQALQADLGDRPEVAALAALRWGLAPREGPAPAELSSMRAHAADLPLPLRFLPDFVDGVEATIHPSLPAARTAFAKAAREANAPMVFALVGRGALGAGDEQLAREMAARSSGASDPASRTLAAFIALLDGRLDEALDIAAKLDGAATDANAIRALVAYERLDSAGLGSAAGTLAWGAGALDALRRGELATSRIRSLDSPDVPLGECLAVDAALDAGNLSLAREIVDGWGDAKPSPARAGRVARLLRYEGRLPEAEATFGALGAAKPTPRSALERVLLLVQAGKPHDAKSVVASNAPLFGDAAPWAQAYADASGGRVDDAKRALGKLSPPPESASLPLRVLAGLTYAAAGDKKNGAPLLKKLQAKLPHHPDVARALAALEPSRARGRRSH